MPSRTVAPGHVGKSKHGKLPSAPEDVPFVSALAPWLLFEAVSSKTFGLCIGSNEPVSR
jgi:hypothetical protein